MNAHNSITIGSAQINCTHSIAHYKKMMFKYNLLQTLDILYPIHEIERDYKDCLVNTTKNEIVITMFSNFVKEFQNEITINNIFNEPIEIGRQSIIHQMLRDSLEPIRQVYLLLQIIKKLDIYINDPVYGQLNENFCILFIDVFRYSS